MSTCYLVMGTPRSGTSAVAGILHHLGIPMGERIEDPLVPNRWDFPEADEWNPKGYFQDAGFMNLEDAEFGNGEPLRNNLSAAFLERLEVLVTSRSRLGDWGLKSNRVPFYLPAFRKACGSAVKIITTRRAVERSIASWSARQGGEYGEALIRAAAVKLKSIEADLTLEYDELIDTTTETVRRLAEFVGRTVTPEALAHVTPELRRH